MRLPGLPVGYYSECLLRVIRQSIRSVVKLDVHTDGGQRGRFARLTVCVDLRRSLVSKIWINGKLQPMEYESLPNICFKCGMVRHGSELCLGAPTTDMETSENRDPTK